MESLYDGTQHLPGYDGYFGYRVYREYVEYVDVDSWTGGSQPKYWSHQEFYDQFNNDKEISPERGVIEFLVSNKLVKLKE